MEHREWMLRSYVVTFGFVCFRLLHERLVDRVAVPHDQLDAFLAYACWALPLMIVEPLIQWRRISGRRAVS